MRLIRIYTRLAKCYSLDEEDDEDLRRLEEVVVLHPTLTHTPLMMLLGSPSEYPLPDED